MNCMPCPRCFLNAGNVFLNLICLKLAGSSTSSGEMLIKKKGSILFRLFASVPEVHDPMRAQKFVVIKWFSRFLAQKLIDSLPSIVYVSPQRLSLVVRCVH